MSRSKKELVQPTSQAVISLCEEFLDMFMGLTSQDLEDKANSLQDTVETFDILRESLRFMIFYKIANQFMQSICVDDFSVQDLLKPTSNRLKRILSGVINFAKLREQQLLLFEPDIQKRESLIENYSLLNTQRQTLEQEVLLSQEKREQNQIIIKQNEERNDQLYQNLLEIKRICSQTKSEYDQIKQEALELKVKHLEVESLISNTLHETEQLQSSIVHSPEKLQIRILDMSDRVQLDRTQQFELDKKSKYLQSKLNQLSLTETDLNACVKVLEECLVEVDKLEHASNLLSSNQELCEQVEINKRKLEFRKEQLLKQLSNAQEKLQHEQQSRNQKLEAAKQRMDQIKEEYQELLQIRSQKAQEADHKQTIIEMTEKQMADMKRELDSQTSLVTIEFEKLKAHVELYIAELLHSIRCSQ
ncbi:spindle pole body protein Nuf2 [Schizosaccharomyces cryophilus OY26]|uniref:Spindle pole body protein Nuf2 n=1 Tax=Schizosaccharomyces cryophilus (strain OY26 / ATCC MYA-4695 / CBS 11777 / NBRC 106824 / NRRL Y48691) TaxID=653667 RepID=S9X4G1_SCHCR|nr:spindle pole body protein Nuf2 [Schizosaccharomyces cryophilus OY26]EPY51962.1 spindle pole body protein Nuf2 [Schizosaccharomyces cryophilus OY26]